MSFEKELLPNNGKLKIKKGLATAQLLDEEQDIIDCHFNGDGCVHIDTENYTYLTLSRENLETLLMLIDKAEDYYLRKKE